MTFRKPNTQIEDTPLNTVVIGDVYLKIRKQPSQRSRLECLRGIPLSLFALSRIDREHFSKAGILNATYRMARASRSAH
jgi:hypothetical protein